MAVYRFETAEHGLGEADRLAAVKACGFDYQHADPVLDAIARRAATLFAAPIALVSIVEEHVQRFAARIGLDATHTRRDVAFCAHALHSPVPLVVQDALLDRRFAGNPLVVGPPHIRFYAGAPLLTTAGLALGTLCVIDTCPREAMPEQLSSLVMLAAEVVAHVERHVAR